MSDLEKPIEGNLADSIAMLEQILEVMPQDMEMLRALYSAYFGNGQLEKAFEYLGQMADVVSGGGDIESIAFVMEELARFEDQRPSEVAAQIARLRTLAPAEAPTAGVATTLSTSVPATPKKTETDISEELALAWKLYEENQLTQEEYSSVLHDLTEVSGKDLDVPVSVLHVLNDRGFTQMNRIMNYMSTRSGVPYLKLGDFELNEQVAAALPVEMAAHEGALPFSFFGNDLLMGVLNPFNNMLIDAAEKASGHRCHTYLVGPEEYDLALGRLREFAEKNTAEAG